MNCSMRRYTAILLILGLGVALIGCSSTPSSSYGYAVQGAHRN